MASDNRLTQLRALVERLERLPVSPRRDWMLQEARSRMVDVETGHEPRAMRALHEEPPARPPEPPRPVARNGRAVKRPSSTPTPAGMPLSHVPKVSTEEAPRSVPAQSRVAEPEPSGPLLGNDDLLWLEDPPGDMSGEQGDGSTGIAPWRRGLRG